MYVSAINLKIYYLKNKNVLFIYKKKKMTVFIVYDGIKKNM